MANLTPYDTGHRAEPRLWVSSTQGVGKTNDPDDWGKVDFDDDSGDTVATIWLERNEHSGQYILHVQKYGPLGLRVHQEE